MAIEIIDGRLEPAQPRSLKRGYGRFERVRIVKADGQTREFKNVATGGSVTAEVERGGEGRFYLTTADGPFGLFAVRRPDGTAHYAHFTNFEPILLVVALLSTCGSIARFGFGVEFPLIGAILGPPMLVGWFYLNGKKQKARRAFEADG